MPCREQELREMLRQVLSTRHNDDSFSSSAIFDEAEKLLEKVDEEEEAVAISEIEHEQDDN